MDTVTDKNNEKLSLLVEGGGSHTQILVTTKSSSIAKQDLPSLNRIGQFGNASHEVIKTIARVRSKFNTIDSSYLALGAATTDMYLRSVCQEFKNQWRIQGLPWKRIVITNDIVPLLFSVDNEANQLVVISGTGSGVAARVAFKQVVRGGAHEYLLGDEGGAYDIGRHGLRAVFAARERHGRDTLLEPLALKWSQGKELDWFVYEASNPKQTIASFAPQVFAADRQRDPVAGQILDRAAHDLAQICKATLERLSWPDNVIVTCTGTLLSEPTARLRSRFEACLLQEKWVDRFETKTVDHVLLYHASETLFSSSSIINTIAQAIPAISF